MENKKIKISVVEDEMLQFQMMKSVINPEEYELSWFKNGQTFIDSLTEQPDIVTLDHYLPDMSGLDILEKLKMLYPNLSVIFFSGQEKVDVVVEAYKQGAKHYIIKSEKSLIEFKNALKNIQETILLRKEVEYLRTLVSDRSKYTQIVGESPEILKVLRLIQKVEKSNFLTLITGESGTGKELVAQAIHFNSPRKNKAFIPVNITAIPEDLIESELFGHEKGAFTGAENKRIGKFEEANGGTIFLDEIGDMNFALQTKLLRVLQDNKITRLGNNKEIELDVRILLATNKELGKLVKDGKFRDDLYYRIQQFLIHIPPLRIRENDVLILSKYFINEFCKKNKIPIKSMDKEVYKELVQHKWPGNVRELKAVVERAVLMSETDIITSDDITFSAVIC